MIKQIQLRGISRTPSDRMTADGGCAESLNVHLEDKELSPTLAPEDVTGELGLPENATKTYVYIHKGNGYVNYVTLYGLEIGAYVKDGETKIYAHEVFAYLENEETLQSITSIGNTLVIMGDKHPYYALFKNGHYIFLGNKIPLPTIQLIPEPVDAGIRSYKKFFAGSITTNPNHFLPAGVSYSQSTWNEKASEAEASGKRFAGIENIPDAAPGEDEEPDLMTYMKEFVSEAYAEAKSNNVFVNQVLALYGVHLYNDRYITSVPILMPGGFESPFFCRYLRSSRTSGTSFTENTEYIQFGARYPYRIKAKMLDFDEETMKLWSDIIMSIDFFITPTIEYDLSNEKVMYVAREYKDSSVISSGTNRQIFHLFEMRPGSDRYAGRYIRRVLEYGSGDFHKADSISTDGSSFESMDRMSKLREGLELDLGEYIASQDLLITQDALADFGYDMANMERVADNVTSMNNRLLMTGITQTIPSGSSVFPAAPCYLEAKEERTLIPYIEESYRTDVMPVGNINQQTVSIADEDSFEWMFPLEWSISNFAFPQATKYVQLVYHIQGRERYVVRGRIGQQGSFVSSVDGSTGYFGFLMFPDIRCKSVDIYVSNDNSTWYMKTYEMREHPGLPCAYMYAGVDKNLLWDVTYVDMHYGNGVPSYFDFSQDEPTADVSQIVEKRIEHREDSVFLSDVDNPWFFPLENQYQLQATEIIGTALATKALSTGQFGQFPLYVFTDNGIWAMQMSSLGTFTSSHAVSMDVAKRGTILSLDQAVVFLSDKGEMLLTGSDLQNLSPNMNGKHYTVESDAADLINKSEWRSLLGSMMDDSHFMSFMEGATPAYDYAGERIIFFNNEKNYMYVYKLRTATWHKMSMPEGAGSVRLLNSYPQALVSVSQRGIAGGSAMARILDFSTALDVSSQENRKAVIVTRPIDLGEPDIRKTIRSIRIRGQYNRDDVKYILLGSMDGLNWGVLPSLRGGSYKWYRMIILADLSPTERISWVDIDYEDRFANKLR